MKMSQTAACPKRICYFIWRFGHFSHSAGTAEPALWKNSAVMIFPDRSCSKNTISTLHCSAKLTFALVFVFWFIYCKRFLIIDLKGIEWESKWKVSSSRTLCVRSHRAFFVFFNNLCISRTFPFLFIQMLLFQIKNQDIYLFL